jgi:peptide deformylase
MSKLPIITLLDPMLREVSTPVEDVNDDIRKLAEDMLETMYEAPGVGLAAIQVAIPKRLIVLDVASDEEDSQPLVMINPEIVELSDTLRTHEEGCLSIPDVLVEIDRPAEVEVQYIDKDGQHQSLQAAGLLATALQHEIDHLDGKLIVDYLSRLKRNMVVRKFKKLNRGEEVT